MDNNTDLITDNTRMYPPSDIKYVIDGAGLHVYQITVLIENSYPLTGHITGYQLDTIGGMQLRTALKVTNAVNTPDRKFESIAYISPAATILAITVEALEVY